MTLKAISNDSGKHDRLVSATTWLAESCQEYENSQQIVLGLITENEVNDGQATFIEMEETSRAAIDEANRIIMGKPKTGMDQKTQEVDMIASPEEQVEELEKEKKELQVRPKAMQSLNMALSILNVHLMQSNVPMEDLEKTLESTGELKVLEDHADDRIAKTSGQPYNLIVTQGIVVDETKALKETTKIKETEGPMRPRMRTLVRMRT